MTKTKTYDEVIAEKLQELDAEHASYQSLFIKYHGYEDAAAKHIHKLLVELCKDIRKDFFLRERK